MAMRLPCLGCGEPQPDEPPASCAGCGAPLRCPDPATWPREFTAWVHRATVHRVLQNYGGAPQGYPAMLTALFRGQQVAHPLTGGTITLPHALTAHEAYPLARRLAGLASPPPSPPK